MLKGKEKNFSFRDIIRKVERAENLKKNAFLLSGMVEWQYVTRSGDVAQFDIITNYYLEEGCVQKKKVKITINNKVFTADPWRMKAVSEEQKEVELVRMELKGGCAQNKIINVSIIFS